MIEERGLPLNKLHFYGAGWQVHLEDLGRSLTSDHPVHADGWSAQEAAPAWRARWTELTPAYEPRGDPLMSGGIRLDGITMNAPDALALAQFYADFLDGEARGP